MTNFEFDFILFSSFRRLLQRGTHDPQSDYAELIEDETNSQQRRIKTIPANASNNRSYVSSRFPIFNSCINMPVRYQTAFLSSLGFLISFGIRCNMGVSVVAMTHNETEKLPNGTVKLISVRLIMFLFFDKIEELFFSINSSLNSIGHRELSVWLIVHSSGVILSHKYREDIWQRNFRQISKCRICGGE
jgi:hypothetical protein